MLDAETDVINEVDDTVENYRVIADYFKRPLVVTELEEKIGLLGRAVVDNLVVEINNGKLPGWLSSFVSLAWIVCRAELMSYDPGVGAACMLIGSFSAVSSPIFATKH